MATRVRIVDPTFVNRGNSMRELRVNQAALIVPEASGLGRSGLFASGSHPVGPTSPTTTSSTVLPCHFAISRPGHGTWLCAVENAVVVDHPAPNSANPRIDLVVGRVYSTDAGDTIPADVLPAVGPKGAQDGVAVIEVIAGTPGAVPVEPNVPVGATKLRAVTMPAGAASKLEVGAYGSHGPYTVARGGVLPINSRAERDALPTTAKIIISRNDLGGRIERYSTTDGKWHLVAPAVLPAIVGTWPGFTEGAFAFDAQGKSELTRIVVPDQQVPVRPSVVAAAEMGGIDNNTRVDFACWIQGASGTYELDKVIAPGNGQHYQRLVTGISNTAEPGGFTVILYGLRLAGSLSSGYIQTENKRFTVSLHAD